MTQAESKPEPLSREEITRSILINSNHPKRCPSYHVTLPNWNGGIFVGAMVRVPKGNIYTIVDIVEDWAVLVPVVESIDAPPAAAYTFPIAELTATSIDEIVASRAASLAANSQQSGS